MNDIFVYLTHLDGYTAYLIIFFILTACGVGLPLPEDIPLIAAGYLVWTQDIRAFPAFLIAMLAILIGDSIIFSMGRKIGNSLIHVEKPPFRFCRPEKVAKAKAQFDKHGDKVVFFGRLVAGLRFVVFFFAGVLKMPYWRFLLFDGLAALMSVPLWIALGYYLGVYFGSQISDGLSAVKHYKHNMMMGLGVVIVIAFISFIIKYWRATHQQ